MIRHAAQTFRHLLLTVLLIIGGVCALEVGLRLRRATKTAAVRSETTDIVSATTTPSRSTFLAVAPRLRFTRVEPESGRQFTLRTNSFGLRNPEIEIPRPAGRFRVLCLGDDNTFAGDLPESLTYVRRLTDELQGQTSTPVEVLNGGCPGGCPTVSALLLRHRFMSLQPDVIIVHVDPSDLVDEETLRRHVERTADGFPSAAMHPAMAGRTNLASQLDDELLLVQTVRDEIRDLWSRGQSGAHSAASRSAELQISDSAFGSIRAALEAIRALADAQSVEVLVSTASSSAATERSPRTRSTRWPPPELAAICEDLQLTLIDVSPDIEDLLGGGGRSGRGKILSSAAHEVYAGVLAQAILNRFTAAPGVQSLPPGRVSSRTVDR